MDMLAKIEGPTGWIMVLATGPAEPRGRGDHRVVARPHRGQRQARPRRSQIRGKETELLSLSSNPPWTSHAVAASS